MDRARIALTCLLVPLLVQGLASVGAAEIEVLEIPGYHAPPGEPILIEAPGDVLLRGDLTTYPRANPGAPGPSIVIIADGDILVAPNVDLTAADGTAARSATGEDHVIGQQGGDGGSIVLDARRIIATDSTFRAGDGGDGGAAIAVGSTDAVAKGGGGGAGGDIHTVGHVVGSVMTVPGDGGDGGRASATGGSHRTLDPSCGGQGGTDAEDRASNATAGDGPSAEARGTDGGCAPPGARGGQGGHAEAYGGHGGPSVGATGGRGGDATAIGGRGGQGMDACFGSAEEAMGSGFRQAGHGGPGGYARAIGGDGGPGAIGGRGGDAYGETRGGDGGNATPPILLGDGGPNFEAAWVDRALVAGGSGGPGVDGGGGGEATGSHESGSGGSPCGHWEDLDAEGIPASVAAPLLGLLLAAWSHRQRGVHEP